VQALDRFINLSFLGQPYGLRNKTGLSYYDNLFHLFKDTIEDIKEIGMGIMNLTREELDIRLERFCYAMNNTHQGWDTAIILSKVNQYYLTGTMQDGVLFIKNDGKALYFVRRSFERAKNESPLDMIYPMNSYRDAMAVVGDDLGHVFIEKEIVTLAIIERLQKTFHIQSTGSLDKTILMVRAIKSPYELYWMESSGKTHCDFLTNVVPGMLREGMSEAELVGELFNSMIKLGYHGVSRFSMFQTEMVVGQVGFGESSLYPTSFDGPGGAMGMSAAVPIVGSRERKLKKGDLVFVDIGFGKNGYHSDKTQVYCFGAQPSDEAAKAHRACIDVQRRLADMLKPGMIPSQIYMKVLEELSEDFKQNFMGFDKRQAKFFGHGIGLHVDEWPVIANGCHDPLLENMALALEPKKGIAGVGMVGVEDTFIVAPDGGRCITGGGKDIIIV